MALTIRPNYGHSSYDADVTESHNLSRYGWFASNTSSNPSYSLEPDRITGTPNDDQIVFEWENKSLMHQLNQWHAGIWSFGITQTRLANGLVVAEAVSRGAMCRFCWSHADRINADMGEYQKRIETATGLASVTGLNMGAREQRFAITLFRADLFYCQLHNELEPSDFTDCGEHPKWGRDDVRYVFGEVGET